MNHRFERYVEVLRHVRRLWGLTTPEWSADEVRAVLAEIEALLEEENQPCED